MPAFTRAASPMRRDTRSPEATLRLSGLMPSVELNTFCRRSRVVAIEKRLKNRRAR
jgi:hypothetical protein